MNFISIKLLRKIKDVGNILLRALKNKTDGQVCDKTT